MQHTELVYIGNYTKLYILYTVLKLNKINLRGSEKINEQMKPKKVLYIWLIYYTVLRSLLFSRMAKCN